MYNTNEKLLQIEKLGKIVGKCRSKKQQGLIVF